MASPTYSPGDYIWVFLNERYGWWPAMIGEEPKSSDVLRTTKEDELGGLRQRYIKELKAKGKEVTPVSDPGLVLEQSSMSSGFKKKSDFQLQHPVTEDTDLNADKLEKLNKKKETQLKQVKKELKLFKKSSANKDEEGQKSYNVKYFENEEFEFHQVKDVSKLKPYDCKDRFDLIKEGVERFDPAHFKNVTKNALESAESRQASFIKDVETCELCAGTNDERVAEYFNTVVILDATPAEMDALEEAAQKKAAAEKAAKRKSKKSGGRRGSNPKPSGSSSSAKENSAAIANAVDGEKKKQKKRRLSGDDSSAAKRVKNGQGDGAREPTEAKEDSSLRRSSRAKRTST